MHIVAEVKDKISFKECKAILNQNSNLYTDEQILKIRDYLYKLAAIEMERFKMMEENVELKK